MFKEMISYYRSIRTVNPTKYFIRGVLLVFVLFFLMFQITFSGDSTFNSSGDFFLLVIAGMASVSTFIFMNAKFETNLSSMIPISRRRKNFYQIIYVIVYSFLTIAFLIVFLGIILLIAGEDFLAPEVEQEVIINNIATTYQNLVVVSFASLTFFLNKFESVRKYFIALVVGIVSIMLINVLVLSLQNNSLTIFGNIVYNYTYNGKKLLPIIVGITINLAITTGLLILFINDKKPKRRVVS